MQQPPERPLAEWAVPRMYASTSAPLRTCSPGYTSRPLTSPRGPLPASLRARSMPLGRGDSIEKVWLEKSLEFWLEIPYTNKMFKNW